MEPPGHEEVLADYGGHHGPPDPRRTETEGEGKAVDKGETDHPHGDDDKEVEQTDETDCRLDLGTDESRHVDIGEAHEIMSRRDSDHSCPVPPDLSGAPWIKRA
jgi:hypothetical protein